MRSSIIGLRPLSYLIVALAFLVGGCAYYNLFYNAEKAFEQEFEDSVRRRSELGGRDRTIKSLGERVEALSGELDTAVQQVARSSATIEALRGELAAANQEVSAAGSMVSQILRSRSWRLTSPLRGLRRFLRRGE